MTTYRPPAKKVAAKKAAPPRPRKVPVKGVSTLTPQEVVNIIHQAAVKVQEDNNYCSEFAETLEEVGSEVEMRIPGVTWPESKKKWAVRFNDYNPTVLATDENGAIDAFIESVKNDPSTWIFVEED
jgi:hypothetical protein